MASIVALKKSLNPVTRFASCAALKVSSGATNRGVQLVCRCAWLGCVCLLLAISLVLSISVWRNQTVPHSKFMDFTVFWTAARFHGDVYDARALTIAQLGHLPTHYDLRPFPYPPSMLLLIRPLALLGYEPALLVWTVAGVAALIAGALLLSRRAIFAFTMLPVALALLVGQVSLFIAGALAGAVGLLVRNENAAGVVFGFVAAIKPQFATLVPVALLSGGHWRGLVWSAATFTMIFLASLLLGPSLWLEWLNALQGFTQQISQPGYAEANIAVGPTFAPIGVALVAGTFWRVQSPSIRLLALVTGTLLCVPYMLIYDLTAACPAVAALLLAPLENLGGRHRSERCLHSRDGSSSPSNPPK